MSLIKSYFKELNNYFDHIYVVTIKRATERHEKIKIVLSGLDYQFFFGADNKEFSIEALQKKGIYNESKAKQVSRYHKAMKPGTIGCSLSHKMVYDDIIKKGYKKVLILEDDILPNEAGLKLFFEMVQELPSDWDLLYFDYSKNTGKNFAAALKQQFYHIQKLFGALNYSHKTISNLFAKPFSTHLKIAGYHDFTSAYCISNKAAIKLAALQTPLCFIADNLLAFACSNKILNGFISIPKLFVQESQFNKNEVGSYAEE